MLEETITAGGLCESEKAYDGVKPDKVDGIANARCMNRKLLSQIWNWFPVIYGNKEIRVQKKMYLFVVLILLCFAFALIIKVFFVKDEKQFYTEDAVQAIALELADNNKGIILWDDSEIKKTIIGLHTAGVINIIIDKNGQPRDCFGNEFKIIYESNKITVTTAGTDKIPETRDDIKYIYVMEKE